jgi:predicted nucleic acid-binding Zn ribbon protein
VQSFSEPTLTECPECGGVLRKEYGSIGVTFNGSGFYRTDSRSGSSSTAKASQGGDAGSSSSSSKSESTSAPAPSGA